MMVTVAIHLQVGTLVSVLKFVSIVSSCASGDSSTSSYGLYPFWMLETILVLLTVLAAAHNNSVVVLEV